MGLCILPYVDSLMKARSGVAQWYKRSLSLDKVQMPQSLQGSVSNFSFFPIILKNEDLVLRIKEKLLSIGVATRRYFYPSLSKLPHVTYQNCPVSEDIASRVLCLPMYDSLTVENIERICEVINDITKN